MKLNSTSHPKPNAFKRLLFLLKKKLNNKNIKTITLQRGDLLATVLMGSKALNTPPMKVSEK